MTTLPAPNWEGSITHTQTFPSHEDYGYIYQGDESFDSYGDGSRAGMDDDDETELDMITDDGDVDEEVCPT